MAAVGLTLCEPVVDLVPDHPPEALQLVVFVEDHVSVDDWPDVIVAGEAFKLTVGAEVPQEAPGPLYPLVVQVQI